MQYNLSLIVAVAQNGAIGKDNDLLWHISDDLKRFKSLTTGHPVIMGRRTFESLPFKPLPKRRNIVLSHDLSFAHDGVEVVHSVDEIFRAIQGEEEAFVLGGAAIYKLLLPYVCRLYVTWVYRDFEADTFFPTISLSEFSEVESSPRQKDSASGLDYAFVKYQRKPE